jgi:hypothetical protein
MCRDTLKNKDSLAKICENCKPEHNARITLQKKYFFIKIRKLKKGPLRGTPHNLSKVSLEVKELEITSKYTATSKNSPKLG